MAGRLKISPSESSPVTSASTPDATESESGAIAYAEKPKEVLQSLLEAYDRKTGDCEDRLDRFLEPYRKSTRSCGLLADYYLG